MGISEFLATRTGKAVAIGGTALALGGIAIAGVRARRRKSATTRKKAKKPTSKKRSRKSVVPRKSKRWYGKTKSKRIKFTKKGQPYVLLRNGKARFIKKSRAKDMKKRSGGYR